MLMWPSANQNAKQLQGLLMNHKHTLWLENHFSPPWTLLHQPWTKRVHPPSLLDFVSHWQKSNISVKQFYKWKQISCKDTISALSDIFVKTGLVFINLVAFQLLLDFSSFLHTVCGVHWTNDWIIRGVNQSSSRCSCSVISMTPSYSNHRQIVIINIATRQGEIATSCLSILHPTTACY